MGQQVELVSSYDAKNETFPSGYTLWKSRHIKKNQQIKLCTDVKLKISASLKETRDNLNFSAEQRLAIEVGTETSKFGDLARYMDSVTSQHDDARVDITCTRITRTRNIPVESMMSKSLDGQVFRNCPEATHFAAQVNEGAFGAIFFLKKFSSSKEAIQTSRSLLENLKRAACIDNVDGDAPGKWTEGEAILIIFNSILTAPSMWA